MLFESRSPHRKPGICPRHPLHSQPCSFCAKDREKNRQSLLKSLEKMKSEKEKVNDLPAENSEGQRLPSD